MNEEEERELHAFLCNLGIHCTQIALAMLVQLHSPTPHAIIPKVHSKACDFLYEYTNNMIINNMIINNMIINNMIILMIVRASNG